MYVNGQSSKELQFVLLTMLDICENGEAKLQPSDKQPRCVIGIDIDIRQYSHQNSAIFSRHPN